VLLRLSFYNAETVKSLITGLQALSLSVYVESNDSIEKSIFKQWGGLSPSNSVADILPDVKCVYSHSDPVKIELGLTRQLETKGKWRKLEGLLTWLECPLPEKLPLTGKQESVVAAVTIEPIESENVLPSVEFLTTRKVDLCLGAEDKGGSCDGVSVACKVGCIDDLKDESDPQAQCCSRCHEAHDNYQRLDERDFWTPQNSAIATKVTPNSNGRFKKAGVHSKEDPRESRNGVFEKSGDLSICLRPFFTETTSRENDNIDPPSPQRVIEWLEYHLLIGFDVVYVLDRYGSSHLPFLEPFVSAGRVLHIPFPFLSNVPLSSDARSSQTTFIPSAHDQIIAYDLCLSIARRRNDFFTAFIDLDEFVRYPQAEAGRLLVSIKELLSNQTDLPDQIFMDRYDVETDWKGFALRHTSRFLEPRLDLKKDGKAHGKVFLNPHSFVYGGALIHRSTRSGSGSVSSIAGGNALSIFHYRPYNMDREVTDMQRGKKGTDTSLQWAHVILSAQFIASAGWRSMKSLSRQGLLRLESVRPPLASGSKPETRPLLFIGILSYCADRDKRDAIRQTWLSSEALEASKTILNVEWKFVLGQESPTEQSPNCQEQALKGEREKLDDILFLPDLNETYQVLTRKTLTMFKWANENVDADFVLKTDDDSYINILAFASDLQQVESPDRPLYWGNHQILSTWLTAQFDIAPKWYIEPEDYPTDAQTYATGAGYFLSRPLVRHLADATSLDSDIQVPWGPEDRMGWLEDASVGYLLRGAVNRASRVVATGIQDTWFHLKCDTENFVFHHVNSSLQMDLHPLLLPMRDLSLEACKQLKSYETEPPKARPGERALATKWGGSFLDRPASPLSIAGPPPFDVPQLSSASANKGSFDGRDVVVVTGSHHNIGRYFVEKLLQGYSRISDPLTILMLDSSEWTGGSIPHSDMNIHSDIQKVDITDYKSLLSQLVAYEGRIRGVVHLAAVSRVQDCHLNMTWCKEVNVNATKNILKALWTLYGQEAAAVDSSILPTPLLLPWLVFASSREVYGSLGPNDVVTEKAPLHPLNIYGETKLWAENAIRQWTINTGFNAIVVRFTNVYGSCHDHQSRLVPNLVSKLAANERFDIFGSADKTISLLHVQDAVQALILSMKYADTLPNRAGTFEPFNIGGGPEHDALNMKDIVRIAQTAVASASPNCKFCYHSAEFRVLRGKNKDRSPEPDHFRSSIEKAFRVLGYQPSRTFGIETIVEYINTCVWKGSA
jgi:nucleoside-diphosphate-sugar epimerase